NARTACGPEGARDETHFGRLEIIQFHLIHAFLTMSVAAMPHRRRRCHALLVGPAGGNAAPTFGARRRMPGREHRVWRASPGERRRGCSRSQRRWTPLDVALT